VLGFFIACGFCVYEKRAARYEPNGGTRPHI